MAFFHFDQNNSGGIFKHDEASGIGYGVIVEAKDADEAVYLAERIGLYFNGVCEGVDCGCCGDRWSKPWRDEGDAEPTVNGKPVAEAAKIDPKNNWIGWWGLPIYVHYRDGRVEKFVHEKDRLQ